MGGFLSFQLPFPDSTGSSGGDSIAGIRRVFDAHSPRSIKRQRSLQKGRDGCSGVHATVLPQLGQVTDGDPAHVTERDPAQVTDLLI